MPTARQLLGPQGPLAAAMDGYEHRGGQLDMADAVEQALAEDRILLCEAGTGTGKTLAYLVPALLSGRQVVVSTASKALQEQIYFKDLPLIEQHLGLQFNAVLVKGLANYLCMRRFDELRLLAGPTLFGDDDDDATDGERADAQQPSRAVRAALPLIEQWASETSSGDIAEVSELEETHPIWPQITSSSDTRIGPKCTHYESCHITQLKRAAESADLLVVNHHLLFADLAIKGNHPGGVLPNYDAVILDEAHRIEDIATSFFGAQVSSTAVERLMREAEQAFVAAERRRDAPRSGRPPGIVTQAASLARKLFAALARGRKTSDGRQPLSSETWDGPLMELYHQLDDTLDALCADASTQARNDTLRAVVQRIEALRSNLNRIVEPDRAQIAWCERRARSIGLAASPVDVGPIVRERLFDRGYPVVLTSASLSTAKRFDFMRSRLGLEEETTAQLAPIDELIVASALDYQSHALLYTPTDLPEVNDGAFVEQATARITELVNLSRGGAFVLCTSLRNMDAIADGLASTMTVPLLRQGDAPKSALLDRFRSEADSVLVATMSFWEGVDVPGEALRLVIIDRIPFAVPTDPLVMARCKALEAAGRSPFPHYSLPQAAIVLKQGFGRLLRTRQDSGVVAILDRRLRTRSYGRSLLISLPPVPLSEALPPIADFFHGDGASL